MKASNVPAKFPVVWAASAATTGGPNGDGYRRTPPAASQIGVHDGFASFTDGYVPLNAQPVASGGVPPYIQDTNGILGLVTAWDQWTQAGGPVVYDSAFASGIGGYPAGALLVSTANSGITWQSTADGNTSNPDGSNPAGWVARPVVTSVVTILPSDAQGDGGLLTLKGSNGAADLQVDNYVGSFRVFTGSAVGFTYNPTAYTLTIGSGNVGRIVTTNVALGPDINGNRVLYFFDSGNNQSGHILQDNTGGSTSQAGATSGNGAIRINPGSGAEVVVDTAGGLTATALNVEGGEITQVGGIVGTTGSSLQIGSGGILSAGAITATSQLNLYGNNVELYAQAANSDGSHTLNAQFVYNNTNQNKLTSAASETQMWAGTGIMSVDINGFGYLRGPLGGSNAAVKQIATTATSERRFKRDIAPLTGGLAALASAGPKRYRYIPGSGEDPSIHRVGWIYEDLRASMPEATLVVDGRGQVDPSWIEPYMHCAILELKEQVATLRSEIAALRAGGAPR